MLKNSAGVVLASLRGSTYPRVRLASSFAAILMDSLFEHPVGDRDPIGATQRSTDGLQIAQLKFVDAYGCFTVGGR